MKIRYKILLGTLPVLGLLVWGAYKYSNHPHLAATALADQVPTAPQLFISGGQAGYESGGLIALSSTEEPAVQLQSYNLSGEVKIDVYQASEQDLLNFLTHDKDGKQVKAKPDTSQMHFVKSFKQTITKDSSTSPKVLLPIGESGIWFLNITVGNTSDRAFVVRSRTAGLVKEGDNQLIFWAQDFKTKRSIGSGSIRIYNLKDSVNKLNEVSIGTDGVAKAPLTDRADVAIMQNGDDLAVIPINLNYLNDAYGNNPSFRGRTANKKYFLFTDRPLYRPGDTVYFKAIVRDDNTINYSIPSGSLQAKVFKDYDEKNAIYDHTFYISRDGAVGGQIVLPSDVTTGTYQLKINPPGTDNPNQPSWLNADYISFDVDFFRKPEYSIDITGPTNPLIAGDTSSFTINGSYFFGQPLAGMTVKYTLYSTKSYDYEYLADSSYFSLSDDYRYGYWGGDTVSQGEVTLDAKGQARVDFDTNSIKGKNISQVFSIEAEAVDQTQNPAFSRKNVLVYPAEFGIYRKGSWDDYWAKTGSKLSLPVTLVNRKNARLSNVNLTASVTRENWVIDSNDPNYKYPTYKKETENLPPIQVTTDSSGNATFGLSAQKPGSYTWNVTGVDQKGNTITKGFYSWVSTDNQPYYFGGNNNTLTIKANKEKYSPNDTAQLFISSTIPDRDIFVTIQRGFVSRYQIISMNGNSAQASFPLSNSDIPNMIATVSSFSNYQLDQSQDNVYVSSDGKKLAVTLNTNQNKFGPGDTVQLDVQTKDFSGNPVSASVAVWAVDKAIYELNDTKPSNIFNAFWSERYDSTQQNNSLAGILTEGGAERGGCFAADTPITMADGTTKAIKDVKVGDYVLTRSQNDASLVSSKVLNTHSAEVAGYLVINGDLKVTENHILNVNGEWREASKISIGDDLTGKDGKPVRVKSIEWIAGKFMVYNLEIENYHTYFADNIWVHNDKGGGGSRTTFKDTAYWNPAVQTDASGHAKISFKLPDNLTTWVMFGIGDTPDTMVGQTENEVVVTKDVVVRPVLPNIMRVGDDIVLSALIQNFTDQDHTFNTNLSFDSGDVNPIGSNSVLVKSKGLEQVFWRVKPKSSNDLSKLSFSAQATDNNKVVDQIVQQIPVRSFGFVDKSAQTSNQPNTYPIKLASDSNKDKTTIQLTFSPSLLGTLPTAMDYLVDYPYGCVEQTTSHFVPALIAKQNPTLYADALQGKNINDIINKGVSLLQSLQQNEGGWRWWHEGNSDPFITSYVVEYLLMAKSLGYKVPDSMLNNARRYLEGSQHYDLNSKQNVPDTNTEKVIKTYALSLLGSDKGKTRLDDIGNLTPDLVAMAVITNNRNGYKDSAEKGLSILRALGQTQGDGVFWKSGLGIYFGSEDASTAWVIRALLTSSTDHDLAAKAARYLANNRHNDYWSNTFATAQVIRAVTTLAQIDQQINPNYSYSVRLDNKEIKKGQVSTFHDSITVKIPASSIKSNGSQLTISKVGDGQIYSTLVVNQFRTDPKAAQVSNGIHIDREYINKDNPGALIGVGDVITVKLTVSGLNTPDDYGVIDDQLPSGLIPVNTNLLNEQYNTNNAQAYDWYVEGKQPTENGMIISAYRFDSGIHTYSYDARAVNKGTFTAPPTTVQLMYSPEIYARSSSQTVSIGEATTKTAKLQSSSIKAILVSLLILLLFGAGYYWYNLRRKKTPPTSPSQSNGIESPNPPNKNDQPGQT
jgi:uncharacterized protein YfaS (alpha-2-macroglobulin family)